MDKNEALKLKDSEIKYKELFENANDGIYANDIEGYFTTINTTMLEILGATEDEVIGSNFSRWLAQESLELGREALIKAISGKPVNELFTLEAIRKNGEHRWVELRVRAIRDGEKITGVHGIVRDITEKTRLEQKLKESEARYRDLFENANDSLYIYDSEGYFKEVNNTAAKLLRCTKEEIIGTNMFEWITPESLNSSRELLKKQIAGEDIEEPIIVEAISKKGEHQWMEIKRRLIKEGDRIIAVHGIGRDITEKRKLEQELIDSEARYRELFENADDPMFTVDTGYCFVGLNHAGLKALGCTKEEVIGTHISRWLTPESFKIAQDNIIKRLQGEPAEQPTALELICKNGEHRWFELKSRVLKYGGRIAGLHGIARDVTEKRRLEQKLREYHEQLKRSYEELIEADRIKTEFVSNVTHELLTPLTSIKGFAELLYDGTTGKINDDQKKSLEIILRNSERLTRHIKGLLDVAQLEKNQFGLQFGLISVCDILSKAAQDIAPQAKDKEITVTLDTKPLPQIWGDEERLTQVITNLLVNAIKFTPQKGTVTLTTAESTNEVKISIADTGIGIPADKLPRIFERFYQIDGSTSRKYGGIGLGLSICKSIVESHYGSIWAESSGNGSTFNIVLPKLAFDRKSGS